MTPADRVENLDNEFADAFEHERHDAVAERLETKCCRRLL